MEQFSKMRNRRLPARRYSRVLNEKRRLDNRTKYSKAKKTKRYNAGGIRVAAWFDSGDWEQYKDYIKALREGELSALADFQLYQDTSDAIDRELVGLLTKDGIKITRKSKHFIARVIGSVEQRRNGVSIEDCKRALQFPTEIRPRKDNSVQYILKGVCSASVNPNTGNLIQANPR